MLMSFLRAQDGNRFWSAAGRRGSRGTAAVLAVVAMLVTSLGSASTALASTGSAVPAASNPVAASVPVAPKAAAAPAGQKLAAVQNLAAAPQALAAATGFATGGTGKYPGSIEWFEWGTDGELIPMAGLTKTNTRTVAGKALATTCTISAPTGQLKAYRSGDYAGDGLDDMYNVGGAGTSNQMVAGIANYTQATQVGFDFTCSVTLAGVSVPLAGLVMADAEASTNVNEYVSATASAGATWRLIDRYRSAGCTADQNVTRSGLTLTFAGAGTACPTYPTGVAFMEGATSAHVTVKGGGVSAVALGVMLFTDFGDAPQSYGDAGALYSPAFTGGAIPAGSSTLFGTNTLAALGQASPRLGAATTAEQAPQPSAAANLDADDALTAPLSITASQGNTYTLPGIAATGGTVRGWIDWNRNGAFDAGEASSAVAPSGGTVALTWTVPADATGGPTYLRLRTGANATAVSSPVGLTTSGEVEDFAVTATVLQPLTCEANASGLLFQGAPTTEYAIDLVTGAPTTVASAFYPQNINGVGYNVLDGYVYGNTTLTAPYNIVRVGAGGAVEVLGPQPAGSAGFLMGDVDANGHYWAATGAKWYEIDLVPGSPTYLQVLASGTAAAPTGLVIGADWAYVPGGGDYLYATAYVGSNNLAALARFNMTTHQWENAGYLGYSAVMTTALPETAGAVYADADGFLYASYNTNGRIYRIDVNPTGNSTGALFSQGPASASNDGARCAQSPVAIDFGDAPDSYKTTLASDGPRHGVPGYDAGAHTAPLMLGTTIDSESDGVPSTGADADDDAGVDDEDGVTSPIRFVPGAPTSVTVTVTNNTAQPATLAGFIDRGAVDGTFGTIVERAIVDIPANSGTATYTVTFPASSRMDETYARFRLFPGDIPDAEALPTGPAAAGEVEDYPITRFLEELTCVADPAMLNTAYDAATGTRQPAGTDTRWEVGLGTTAGLGSVATWSAATVVSSPFPSWAVAPMAKAGWISHSATGAHTGNYDEYYRYRFSISDQMDLADFSLPMDFFADNTVAEVWVNGIVQSTTSPGLPSSNGPGNFNPAHPGDPYWYEGFVLGAQASTVLTGFQHGVNEIVVQVKSAGPASGFMASMRVGPLCQDFGDAPASYGTTQNPYVSAPGATPVGGDGARHAIVEGVYLGAAVDADPDGQPSTGADGDDDLAVDDEDGVVFNPALGYPNATVRTGIDPLTDQPVQNALEVTASAAGFVSVWVDWNQDGDFLDAGEQVTAAQPVTAGANMLAFAQSNSTGASNTYVRVRYSTDAASVGSPLGAAPDGEVEDYRVTVQVLAMLQVLKVGEDSTGTVVPMDGSAWAVYTQETGGNAVVASIAPAVDGGGASITGLFRDTLTPGTYWLEETKALPGFELLAGRVPFTVAPDGNVMLGATASANITVVDIDGVRTIRVEDVPKLELPDAGGFGTLPIYLAGALLLAVAAAIATASAVRRHKASQRVQGRNQ